MTADPLQPGGKIATEGFFLREATLADAEALNGLSRNPLGYTYPLEQTERQLSLLLKDPEHKILVAEIEGRVKGYIHLQSYVTLYAPPMKNVLGLAVDSVCQGRGLGKALLAAGEDWARAEGAAGVRIASGEERKAAHQFYVSQGYEQKKMQLNLQKLW